MISAILLAAGQSKRMKGENKLIKKIQGVPLIKHSVKNILASSIDELIVVLGYQKETIENIIDKNKKIKYKATIEAKPLHDPDNKIIKS